MEYLGFYGKLPGHGDFLYRRLSQQFISGWDKWMQHNMLLSRRTIGEENWSSIYLNSPTWRFVLSDKIIDDQVWSGVVVPSFDRVGRHYPIVVAKSWQKECSGLNLLGKERQWFESIENLAVKSIKESYTAKQLDEEVKLLEVPKITDLCDDSIILESSSKQDNLVIHSENGRLLPACAILLESFIKHRLPKYSFWWSNPVAKSEISQSSLLIASGLPTEQSFVGMLNRSWPKPGLAEVS